MSTRRRAEPETDVLILGASYVGAELVYLLRSRAPELRLTVIDRQTTHGYIPLVHERLVARLDWDDTRFRTAEFVRRSGATFVHGDIVSFDPEAKRVKLADGRTLGARFVIVALGSVTTPPEHFPGREHFVGHKLAAETDEARRAIARVLSPLSVDDERPHAVIVGGGISGIEMAGELAHLAVTRPMKLRPPHVTLVHGATRLVPNLAENVSAAVEKSLVKQGVTVCHATRVLSARPAGVLVRGTDSVERLVRSDLSFWCGGVRPPAVLGSLGLPLTPEGFLRVTPTLGCGEHGPDVLAGGDCARVVDEAGTVWPTMQRAIECFWAAETLADQITRLAGEAPTYPRGIPTLRQHPLRPDFFHGLSLGGDSLVVYGERLLDLGAINIAFRRFLMWGYFRRYGQWSSPFTRWLSKALAGGEVAPRPHGHLGEGEAADP